MIKGKTQLGNFFARSDCLGNFCLIAGINPQEVQDWYLAVYADAYQWVELPNVSGMILYADGGKLATKPYAASGNYINKMSDYCKGCRYKVSQEKGGSSLRSRLGRPVRWCCCRGQLMGGGQCNSNY